MSCQSVLKKPGRPVVKSETRKRGFKDRVDAFARVVVGKPIASGELRDRKHDATVIPANFFFIKLFNGLRGFLKIFFVDFLSGFAGIFIPVRQKKSLKISFFMEKGMVCEKEKLAGMTDDATCIIEFLRQKTYRLSTYPVNPNAPAFEFK